MRRSAGRFLAGFVAAAGVTCAASWHGSLSPSGAAAATFVGTLAFTHGWRSTSALLTFFLSSSALSHLPRTRQHSSPRRTATQVLANGGVASAAWLLSLARCTRGVEAIAHASLATAAADTWATEIGQRWGGTPRIITSGRHVMPGGSGGITPLGTVASAMGAFAVAVSVAERRDVARLTLCGLIGALVDSVLGATLQGRFACSVCGVDTEERTHCGKVTLLQSGFGWMSNDSVNALATITGGLATLGLRR